MPPPPSENLRSSESTFHSRSEGGFFCGLLKYISYSIFSRRKCDSSRVSSSSMVIRISDPGGPVFGQPRIMVSLGEIANCDEVPAGHERECTEVSRDHSGIGGQRSAVSRQPLREE